MIEYICLALLAFIGIQDYLNRKERKRLMEAFFAKNLAELKEAERPVKPLADIEDKPPDSIPLDEATPEQFDTAIRKEVGEETFVEKVVDNLKGVVKRGNR